MVNRCESDHDSSTCKRNPTIKAGGNNGWGVARVSEEIQRILVAAKMAKKVRYRGLTAHARARYRCFLPDLAGLARVRRVRPIPDLNYSSIPKFVNWMQSL